MITIKPMAGYGIIIMLWNNDNSSKTWYNHHDYKQLG
jgi:hypothetical protein